MKKLNDMTFKVVSLGCKVNYYECEAMARLLESHGLTRINDLSSKSDITIINSCAVTEEGSRKTKQIVRRHIASNKDGIIAVSGCLTQVDESIKDIDGVNIVLGTNGKSKIFDALSRYYNTHNQYILIEKDVFHSEFEDYTVDRFEAHTRAFLKVQDGCVNFCSYCIIPYARGNSRSKPLHGCINEAKKLVSNGHKEIVLTGIDTGSYGKDINSSLLELLIELDKIQGLERIRISSIEITQVNDEIIDFIKNSKKIVKHIHIPIQSGSDRILKLMNRHYDKEYFINKVKKIRESIDNISITTDFICGFPTETEEDFNESLDTLNKIGFQTIHTFPYSLRKGTKAALMEQVPQPIKKERVKKVLELSKKGYQEYCIKNLGNKLDVIFEIYKNGYIYGHTGNYIYVKAKSDISNLNKLLNIKLLKIENDAILSEIMED